MLFQFARLVRIDLLTNLSLPSTSLTVVDKCTSRLPSFFLLLLLFFFHYLRVCSRWTGQRSGIHPRNYKTGRKGQLKIGWMPERVRWAEDDRIQQSTLNYEVTEQLTGVKGEGGGESGGELEPHRIDYLHGPRATHARTRTHTHTKRTLHFVRRCLKLIFWTCAWKLWREHFPVRLRTTRHHVSLSFVLSRVHLDNISNSNKPSLFSVKNSRHNNNNNIVRIWYLKTWFVNVSPPKSDGLLYPGHIRNDQRVKHQEFFSTLENLL